MNSISIFSTTITSPSAPIHTINFSFPEDKARHDRMGALVTQMLQSISTLMARNGFRKELIRVLRLLNNSGLLPIRAKTALRRNRPISSGKLQDAKRRACAFPFCSFSHCSRNTISLGWKRHSSLKNRQVIRYEI